MVQRNRHGGRHSCLNCAKSISTPLGVWELQGHTVTGFRAPTMAVSGAGKPRVSRKAQSAMEPLSKLHSESWSARG